MVLLNLRREDGFYPNSKRLKYDGFGSYGVPASKMDPIESDDDVAIDHPAPRKYPPPRILKDFPVQRAFPAGNGKQNSVSKNFISSNGKSVADFKPLEVSEKVGISREFRVVSREDSQEIVSRAKVEEALNQFQKLFTRLSREHKGRPILRDDAIHTTTAMTLKLQQKCVNAIRRLGPVPGVQVGDKFRWRAELYVIGLHYQFTSGIDYMEKDGKTLALSIVASGRYANQVESSDVLIYSGHGGNPKIKSTTPVVDQKLERGNLALKNSMEARTPIRVIRGTKISRPSFVMDTSRKKDTSYVYDGLYLVEHFWQERGEFGKLVFKFFLKRISGQPKLSWEKTSKSKNTMNDKKPSFHKDGYYVNDISQGKEKRPIPVVNTIDDEKPSFFNYISEVTYPKLDDISMPSGCDCIDGCSDSEDCACTIKNGGEIPYNYKECIVEEKHEEKPPIIYECGPSCKCYTSCINRVSQRGIRFQLEVFKTPLKGWGVQSRSYIPCGSFICEYVGEVLQDNVAEQRVDDAYLFDLEYNHEDLLPNMESSSIEVNGGFTIDAGQYGNVGRFINHSCSPNLYAQNVLYDHGDKRLPHIMLFARKNIPPLQELSYNYNYRLGEVLDGNGNIRVKNCYCGSTECTGRMY